MYEVN